MIQHSTSYGGDPIATFRYGGDSPSRLTVEYTSHGGMWVRITDHLGVETETYVGSRDVPDVASMFTSRPRDIANVEGVWL